MESHSLLGMSMDDLDDEDADIDGIQRRAEFFHHLRGVTELVWSA